VIDAQFLTLVRDLAFIGFLLVTVILGLMLYRKVSGLTASVKRTVESIEKLAANIPRRESRRRGLPAVLRRFWPGR